jgi:hypothetical protein
MFIQVKSALDFYIGDEAPHSLRRGELAVGVRSLESTMPISTRRLAARAPNARVGLAKALGGHDRRGDSSLH